MVKGYPVAIRRRFASVLGALLVLAPLAGCGAANTLAVQPAAFPASHAAVKTGGTVTIDNVSGALWTCSFNPFSASVQFLSDGIIYEPLIYVNSLTGRQTPWLATSYTWSNGNKTLTFTMRTGVKWSDGKPLTAQDVVYTFELMKRYSALDLQAVWSVLSGVKAQRNTVVFTFKQAATPFFYYIADQNFIVPQHIWSKVKNPVTYIDRNPVGSGPFTMHRCSPQNIEYTRNASYWQRGRPHIAKVEYPAFMGNESGNQYLAQGNANWGGQYIPNVQAYYLSRDPAHRHIWYPPSGDLGLYLNLKVAPLNDLKVRQALACAIDRKKVSTLGVYGYLPPANQTGITVPTNQSWFDAALDKKYDCGFNLARAAKILQSDGYKKGSNGLFTKNGKPLSLTVINVGGFTDWVAELNVMARDLQSTGIKLTVQNLSSNDWTAREDAGHFQMAYGAPTAGPTPYYWLRALLYSKNTAPIGGQASSNFERFSSPQVDAWFNQYAATTNLATQKALIRNVERTMLTQIPYIPVLEEVNWYQYDTSHIEGWPTKANPYASPAPYNFPDWEVVLMNLYQK